MKHTKKCSAILAASAGAAVCITGSGGSIQAAGRERNHRGLQRRQFRLRYRDAFKRLFECCILVFV